mgnify:CR=1 FL=1
MTTDEILALERAEGLSPNAGDIQRLSVELGPDLARWAIDQWALRARGAEKFARAKSMLFTRTGLEMASHEEVAAWHASLFPRGELVIDGTCGLGSDLVALAHRGPAIGLDLEESHTRYAKHNLKEHGLSAKVLCTGCLEWIRTNSPEYVFADPARRSGRKRTLNPSEFEPNLDELVALLTRCKLAVLKLSPMLSDVFLESLGGKLIFVSHRGECKEAVVVFGSDSGRFAYQIEAGGYLPAFPAPASIDEPLAYLYEADPAAIRAHALGEFGLSELGSSNGYLTGEERLDLPWIKRYEVVWHGSWRPKSLKQELDSRTLRVDAVKTRGVNLEPRAVQKSLEDKKGLKQKKSRDACVVALYPVGKSIRAVILIRD